MALSSSLQEGKKLPDALQDEINQELEKDFVIEDTANLGKSIRVKDANGRYIEFCKSTFPYHLDLNELNHCGGLCQWCSL